MYLVTTLVPLRLAGGFVLAVLTTTVNQRERLRRRHHGSERLHDGGAPGLDHPGRDLGMHLGTNTGATSAGTVTLVLSSTAGGTVCTTGDFAEEFPAPFTAIIRTPTNTFTIITKVAGGPTAINQESVARGLIGVPPHVGDGPRLPRLRILEPAGWPD
jgi:hypothetical protein